MTGTSPSTTYDYIILGAGVAGLSAGYKLAQAGRSVLVLEKAEDIGGLARTVSINGFQFDYCAHRFHSSDPELMQEMIDIMSPNFAKHRQKSRIHLFGKYLKYPFELPNLLRAMPKTEALHCSWDFVWNTLTRSRKQHEVDNYRDWFIHFFGERLYKIMCEPYTRKIWGMDPALLSSDWADKRFQKPNIAKLIQKTMHKILTFDFSSYSLEDERLAPDAGEFYYPVDGGFQAIPHRFAELIEEQGKGQILTDVTITAIDPCSRTVSFEWNDMQLRSRARYALITTIPLHSFVQLLTCIAPSHVYGALSSLRYMDIIFVLLFLERESVSYDTWLYFPDPSIAFNRAVEFKNWSRGMAPAGKTSLCLDITVTPENEHLWSRSHDALARKCIDDCEQLQLCSLRDVSDTRVLYVRNAYPVYDLHYKKRVEDVVRFIESFPGVFCVGRTGIFRYQNSDGSIDMGFGLVRRLLTHSHTSSSLLTHEMAGVSY